MITINARADMTEALRALGVVESQMAFAMAKALTATGQDVKEAETKAIRSVFDRPTPYTQRAVYLRPATKQRLQAVVWLKDGNRTEHYLLPQIQGGSRPMKRFEERLRMSGYMTASERAVPAQAAQLDAYGNMSRGQINQILSQLKTAVVQGDYSNATNSKRSRAKRATVEYFVARRTLPRRGWAGQRAETFQQHLPNGVWERRRFSWGTSVRPVLLFVTGVTYRRRFDFFGIGERTIAATLPRHLQSAAAQAMRTARFNVQGSLL